MEAKRKTTQVHSLLAPYYRSHTGRVMLITSQLFRLILFGWECEKNRRRLPWFRKHVSWVRKEMKCLWWGKKRPHWGGVIKEEQYEDALASRSSFRLWGWGFGQHCQSKHLHIPPQRTRCEPFTHFLVSPNQHLPSGVTSFILSLHCGFACVEKLL